MPGNETDATDDFKNRRLPTPPVLLSPRFQSHSVDTAIVASCFLAVSYPEK